MMETVVGCALRLEIGEVVFGEGPARGVAEFAVDEVDAGSAVGFDHRFKSAQLVLYEAQ